MDWSQWESRGTAMSSASSRLTLTDVIGMNGESGQSIDHEQ